MAPTIFISGPMRGHADFNYGAFREAAKRLEALGWKPVNPVDVAEIYPCREGDYLDPSRLDRILKIDEAFVASCHAIYLLRGWQMSIGAQGELAAFLASRPRGSTEIYLEGVDEPEKAIETW